MVSLPLSSSTHLFTLRLTLDRHLPDRAQHTEPLAYVMKPARSGELAAVFGWRYLSTIRNKAAIETGYKAIVKPISNFGGWWQG